MAKVVLGTRGTSAIPEYGGSTWVRLQYMLGLTRLGHQCYWVDRVGSIDPYTHHHSLAYLTARFERLARDFGFAGRYAIVYNEGERHFGMSESELSGLCDQADLLLNISGYLPEGSPLMRIPRRAYVDVDPGFTQIWGHQWDMGFGRHNLFFTTGQNVGSDAFTIPLSGIRWVPMLPPVVLEAWPARIDERCLRFSTLADWRSGQDAFFEGSYYGGKRSEFVRFLGVPRLAGCRVELAASIHSEEHEDHAMLFSHDWTVLDPYFYAGDPESYREFIQCSRAEFSVAKSGYVKSNSGWISDRTACYLASGKPAIVQSTGLEPVLPTGKGLLTFHNVDEAVQGIAAVQADYQAHCLAARELAEHYFDSDVVLGKLLLEAGLQ